MPEIWRYAVTPRLASAIARSAEAVDIHKAQPHFKLWSDFKASGGVASSVSSKGAFPGDWGYSDTK